MIPYRLMYMVGFTPWERRPVEEFWERMLDGPGGLALGRALDIGAGSGRDAVHLAGRGWRVTAIEREDAALAQARTRAAEEEVDVRWVQGDVGDLGGLGLDPGFDLIYDFGCIHGLSDGDRARALDAVAALAAPGATILVLAFKRGRRLVLPRGMDEAELVRLLGDRVELEGVQLVAEIEPSLPPPVRRARPALYRLRRRDAAAVRSSAPSS